MDAPDRDALTSEIRALQCAFSEASWRLADGDDLSPIPDLTSQQFRVLSFVARNPGVGSSRVSRLLGVTAPTSSGIVDRLVERNLLARTEDVRDRRVRRLTLTLEGAQALRELESVGDRMLARLIPHLDTELMLSIRDVYVRMLAAIPDTRSVDVAPPEHQE